MKRPGGELSSFVIVMEEAFCLSRLLRILRKEAMTMYLTLIEFIALITLIMDVVSLVIWLTGRNHRK